MILDARTLVLLAIDVLSFGAILVALVAGHRSRRRSLSEAANAPASGRAGKGAAAGSLEELARLASLAAAALVLLRILAWALFFLVLDGLVPNFAAQGVMCPYGVVELSPVLARAALWSKPATIALWLGWWALASAERDTTTSAASRGGLARRLASLPFLLALTATELALELLWLAADKQPLATLCCSAARVAERAQAWDAPGSLFGLFDLSAPGSWLAPLGLWLAAKSGLVVFGLSTTRRAGGPHAGAAWMLAAASLAIGALDLVTWREVLAPRALGLEFHRCAYELVTRSVALGPAALVAALAHLSFAVTPWLARAARRESAAAGVERASAALGRIVALFLATEVVVVLVHAL